MAGKQLGIGQCAICGRKIELTFHHFIPRSMHSNKWFEKRYTKEQMKSQGCGVCWDCHSFIHTTFDEKELGREYNSLEKILANEKIQKFIPFVRKQKNTITNREFKRR